MPAPDGRPFPRFDFRMFGMVKAFILIDSYRQKR